MSYATLDDLIDYCGEAELIGLTDREAAATGAIDMPTIEAALDKADAEINGYIARRYVLPLATTPPIVIDLACVLTLWKLHIREPTEKYKKDHEEAQRKLREIGEGKFVLDVAGLEPETTSNAGARVTDRDRPFTETSLKSFI
ncbi:MAG: DUF1320 domain-containing protein [Pseudomonadota bacterium]